MSAKRHRDEIPPVVAGSFGGFWAAIASFPLDTIRVRVMSGNTQNLFKGIFSGIVTPISMCTPFWASIYWGYKSGKRLGQDTAWSSTIGGFGAGVSASVVYGPLQSIKVTAQVHKISSAEALRSVWDYGGVRRGLYRGYVPGLAYTIPGFTAFFTVFDEAKVRLAQHGHTGIAAVMGAAFIAAAAESTFGMPGETVQFRYIADRGHSSPLEVARSLWQSAGIQGFYRGFPLRLAFGGTINGVSLSAIELLHRWWES